MPLGTRLSKVEAAKIDAWITAEMTQTYCAKMLKRSNKAVHTYLKTRDKYFEPHKNGSKKVLKEREKRAIIRHISGSYHKVEFNKVEVQKRRTLKCRTTITSMNIMSNYNMVEQQ